MGRAVLRIPTDAAAAVLFLLLPAPGDGDACSDGARIEVSFVHEPLTFVGLRHRMNVCPRLAINVPGVACVCHVTGLSFEEFNRLCNIIVNIIPYNLL